MKTDLKTLQSADLAKLSRDVGERIGLLSAAIQGLEPGPLGDKIAQDLMLPCFILLAQFCTSVQVRDDDGAAHVEPSEFLEDLAELARDGRRFRALNRDVWPDEVSEGLAMDGSIAALDRARAAIDAHLLSGDDKE